MLFSHFCCKHLLIIGLSLLHLWYLWFSEQQWIYLYLWVLCFETCITLLFECCVCVSLYVAECGSWRQRRQRGRSCTTICGERIGSLCIDCTAGCNGTVAWPIYLLFIFDRVVACHPRGLDFVYALIISKAILSFVSSVTSFYVPLLETAPQTRKNQ